MLFASTPSPLAGGVGSSSAAIRKGLSSRGAGLWALGPPGSRVSCALHAPRGSAELNSPGSLALHTHSSPLALLLFPFGGIQVPGRRC